MDDRRLGRVTGQTGDEAAVELDDVRRHRLQPGEGAVAGAEVVQGQPDAELLDRVEPVPQVDTALQDRRLGDLQDQPGRVGQPAGGQFVGQHRHEVGLGELPGADVHRHVGQPIAPVPQVMQGRPEHVLAERNDQAGLLGDRDELGRRHQVAVRPPQPHQSLGPDDPASAERDDRLKPDRQAEDPVAVQGRAQQLLGHHPALRVQAHRVVEHPDPVPASLLGRVHGQVGALQGGFGLLTGRTGRDADAHGQLELPAGDDERLGAGVDDCLPESLTT